MSKIDNKWMRAVLPALLIHCSIGTVYCWSLFKADIAHYIDKPLGQVEWAFSLAIFVLGMSAAFGGRFVEKDIKRSAILSTLFFTVGMLGTGFFIYQKSLIGIYICYGVIMGIGLGIGYLTPVKNLMLWFKERKGLATGIAVAGFGLAKVIASPLMENLLGPANADGVLVTPSNVYMMFYILAAVYLICMLIGFAFIRKPEGHVESASAAKAFSYKKVLTNKTFIGIWIMFYINITCGLALISQEKSMLAAVGFTAIGFMSAMTAVFNAGGRLFFSAWADRLRDRNTIYKVIFGSALISIGAMIVFDGINAGSVVLVVVLLCVINAGYGGGFSNLPTLLADRFGINSISTIHGLALSAWAFAGLSGNQLSAIILEKTGSYDYVMYAILALFLVALAMSVFIVKPGRVTFSEKAVQTNEQHA